MAGRLRIQYSDAIYHVMARGNGRQDIRVVEAVCSRYGVDRSQLAARGSCSQTRAARAYLAKHHTESSRTELVPILGLSRPESVPNLSTRFAALLQAQSNARRDLVALEVALGLGGENSAE